MLHSSENLTLSSFTNFERIGKRTAGPAAVGGFYGANGAVYSAELAEHRGRMWAIKLVLNLHNAPKSHLEREFRPEYDLQAAKLRHPNVARLLALFFDKGDDMRRPQIG